MKHVVSHDLDEAKAKAVARAAFESYKARFAEYNPSVTWPTDKHADIAFRVKGISLTGGVDVTPSAFELDLEVPFLLKPFKGKAISVIEQITQRQLGPVGRELVSVALAL